MEDFRSWGMENGLHGTDRISFSVLASKERQEKIMNFLSIMLVLVVITTLAISMALTLENLVKITSGMQRALSMAIYIVAAIVTVTAVIFAITFTYL